MSAVRAWTSEAPTLPRRSRRPADPERRAGTRLPLEIDVTVEGAAHRFASSTVDVSTGGMFVATQYDIPIGTHVVLAFSLPNGTALEVIGVVQWRRERHEDAGGDPGLGIAFFCLAPEVKQALDEFCAVREPLYAAADDDVDEHAADDEMASGAYPVIVTTSGHAEKPMGPPMGPKE